MIENIAALNNLLVSCLWDVDTKNTSLRYLEAISVMAYYRNVAVVAILNFAL